MIVVYLGSPEQLQMVRCIFSENAWEKESAGLFLKGGAMDGAGAGVLFFPTSEKNNLICYNP